MEISNLLLTKDPKEIKRFLSLYSSNKESRQKMVVELLNENIFNMEKIESADTTDITRRIFDSYLTSMGLKLTDEEDESNSVLN